MSAAAAAAFVLAAFALAWRFEDKIIRLVPAMLCALGLALYVLAFFRLMPLIDIVLLVCGAFAAVFIFRRTKKEGARALRGRLRRQFCDPYLLFGLAIIIVMCLLLRGEQILEWDGYSFWGPDTKSLFFRGGFAPKYSNAAMNFGDYPPFSQLIWWWFLHITGTYGEQYIFMAYYAFGALILLSLASNFQAKGRISRFVTPPAAAVCAVILPGAACTAWYRAIYVDSLMAMLFGMILSVIVCREEYHPRLWKAQIIILTASLTLVKSVGFLWSALAVLFCFMWWLRERREYRFAALLSGGICATFASWAIYCKLTERSTYLTEKVAPAISARLGELFSGNFLQAGDNWGYITSYGKAFLLTPIHRESTPALDLTPALLIVLLFAGAAALCRFGFVPRAKLKRLIVFMTVTFVTIYTLLGVGQMTMFYGETQYLSRVSAVTLMTRYCSPANMGILILLCAFASGRAAGRHPAIPISRPVRAACWAIAAVFLLSCGAYSEMERRFIHDPLDERRIELRRSFVSAYADFLSAAQAIPIDNRPRRVLLAVYQQETSPIVTNEASPTAFYYESLSGDSALDLERISSSASKNHAAYFYAANCTDELSSGLSALTEGGLFEKQRLYKITNYHPLALAPSLNEQY